MNLMSSIAKTLVGSSIAMVTLAPALETGMMVYLRATSAGISLTIESSIVTWLRLMAETLKCFDRNSTSSGSLSAPILTRLEPSRPPSSACLPSASLSCWGLILPALTSKSPNRSLIEFLCFVSKGLA